MNTLKNEEKAVALPMYIQYQLPLRFTRGNFNAAGGVKASAVLHAFQEIAKAHATSAGLGFDVLMAKNLIWVITKMRFQVLREPAPEVDCTLLSLPRRSASLIYDRDFYVLSPAGERLIVGTSQWCIVNALTRRVERTDLDFRGVYTPDLAIPEGIPRLRPRDLEPVSLHTVTRADLDENDHTNNCRYADMALEVLGLTSVRELTVNFASETRLGDEIELLRGPGNVAAGRHNGNLVFAAKAE